MSLYHPLGIEPPASVAGHPPVSLRAPSVPPAVTRPCPCSLGRLALAEGLGLQRPPVPQDPGPEAPAGELEESGPPALTCSGSAGAPHLLLLSLPSAVLSHRFPSANLVDCDPFQKIAHPSPSHSNLSLESSILALLFSPPQSYSSASSDCPTLKYI